MLLFFCVISRSRAAEKLPEKREDCLSAASFAAPGNFEQHREFR